MAEFAYNNSENALKEVSPFFAAYECHSWMNDEVNDLQITVSTAQDCAAFLLHLRSHLKGSWSAIANKAAHNYNKNRKEIALRVGDWVWLSGRNIKMKRPSKKLNYKFYRFFEILAAVSSSFFWLNLLSFMKNIHPVFHVNLLERAERSNDSKPPSIIVKEDEQ